MSRARGHNAATAPSQAVRDIEALARLADTAQARLAFERDRDARQWEAEPETMRAGVLSIDEIGAIISVRTAGNPGSREPHHRTVGRLVGIRPYRDGGKYNPEVIGLSIQAGRDQATIPVAIGEPVTIRRHR